MPFVYHPVPMTGALRPDFQAGSCRVDGATGALTGSQSGNVVNSVRTGVGVYEITLRPGCAANEHVMDAQVLTTTADATDATIEPVSNLLVRVRTTGIPAGAVGAVDASFYFSIERVST